VLPPPQCAEPARRYPLGGGDLLGGQLGVLEVLLDVGGDAGRPGRLQHVPRPRVVADRGDKSRDQAHGRLPGHRGRAGGQIQVQVQHVCPEELVQRAPAERRDRAPHLVHRKIQPAELDHQRPVLGFAELLDGVRTGDIHRAELSRPQGRDAAVRGDERVAPGLDMEDDFLARSLADVTRAAQHAQRCSRVAQQVDARAQLKRRHPVPDRPAGAERDCLRRFDVRQSSAERFRPVDFGERVAVKNEHGDLVSRPGLSLRG
jgi:hypothetical protein